MDDRDAVILGYVRTPIGRYGGALSLVRPDDLAAFAVRCVLERAGVDGARVDEVVLGDSNGAGEDNRNVGRMAAILAGLPEQVPGVTVNRLCGSGLEAVNDAARRIRQGEADVVVAGGVESMSRAPWVMLKPSEAFPRGERTVVDTYLGWRLVNPRMLELGVHPISLGETAENVAEQEGIGREDQDAYAARSQARYAKAKADGFYSGEIAAVETPAGTVAEDEHPRPDSTVERLAKLKPAFRKGGTVTAGNSSGVNDGAAALVLASRAAAKALGKKPLGRVVAAATAGVHSDYMGLGPVPAVRKLVQRTGVEVDACDAIELNEAFAAQVIAVMRRLSMPEDRTNPNGGAIAIGHPIGASGARIAGTLLRELARRNGRYGIATACIGVGQGIATLFERET
ncbi:MAG: beta-ketoadipyl CoA thiolase [Chloroflexi bacterium RIFCSPLOWO2_02_FULL_71_16]|nr:MAG: beta-ketoadipyl CoA thiolase [Chloroflexi bacterium RIFCSPLOWO2_02_FULL_71_16]